MNQYVLLAIALTLNACANIFIKAGMRGMAPAADTRFLLQVAANGWLWAGVLSFGAALAFYSAVLAKMPLSLAYPLMTTIGFAIVLVASAVFFHERLQPAQYAGIGLIVVGVWLAARGG